MKIWVDGDALPGAIKEIILRGAARLEVDTVFVANKHLQVGSNPRVTFMRVTQGADVADAYIVDRSAVGDLCVTADIPLAAALVAKGVVVIDPRGDQYSHDNVGDRLSTRDLMASLREEGLTTQGPPPFSAKAKQKFAASFDRLLTRALRTTTRP